MMTRDEAVQQVINAWTISGKRPDLHEHAKQLLEAEWPSLARAVNTLVAVDKMERDEDMKRRRRIQDMGRSMRQAGALQDGDET